MASATLPDAPVKRPSGLNPRTVFSAVRRRPLAFVGVLLLAAGAGSAVWFFLPVPKLTAAVGFHLSPPRSVTRDAGGAGAGEMAAFKASQAARVKSRLVLNAALNEKGVKDLQVIRTADPDALTWLDRNLKADTKGGSPDALRVTLEGDEADEMTKVLAAVSAAYLQSVDKEERRQRRGQLDQLTKEHDKYQAALDGINRQMDNLMRTVGRNATDYESLDQMLRIDQTRAAAELKAAQGRLDAARDNLAAVDNALNPKADLPAGAAVGPPAPDALPGVSDAKIDRALNNDPGVVRLRSVVEELRLRLKKFEEKYEEGAPDLLKAQANIREAEARLAEYRASRRAAIVRDLEETFRGNAAEARERFQAQIKAEEVNVGKAQQEVKKIDSQFQTRIQLRTDLEMLKRNSETTQATAKMLAAQKDHLNIELEAPLRVSKMEEPFVLPGLEGNRRMKYALVAAAVAFVLGFGGLVGWEARSRRVTHTDDVTTDLGVRLLGTVPPTGGAGAPGAPPAALAEAIDTARTMLLHGTPGGPAIRTVLVTSGVAGEGKTSLAGHLSISLARAGFRTVLVDGDLQSPSAHRLFDCPVGPGLCELLRDEVELDDAARPTPVPGLALLPAGRWDTAARQSLVGDRWRRLKADLEARYDFVVVDSAPLLLVSDTLLLAREADGVVLSVLLGVSQVSHVAETAGRLQAVGAKLTGAVVNGVWHRAYRAGSAYRYAAAAPGGAAVLGEAGGEDRA